MSEVKFDREDVVYDDGCAECGTMDGIAYVNREESDNILCTNDYMNLAPRARTEFIRIDELPSGKLTAEDRINAVVFGGEGEEFELDENGVEVEVKPEV